MNGGSFRQRWCGRRKSLAVECVAHNLFTSSFRLTISHFGSNEWSTMACFPFLCSPFFFSILMQQKAFANEPGNIHIHIFGLCWKIFHSSSWAIVGMTFYFRHRLRRVEILLEWRIKGVGGALLYGGNLIIRPVYWTKKKKGKAFSVRAAWQ